MRICPQCESLTEDAVCPVDGFQTVDAARFRAVEVDPLVGTIFVDRYRIDSVLGRGGMGSVYKATQIAVGRPVAIKVLKGELSNDLKEIARFQQEARSIASLRHPNTVRLYDFGAAQDGRLYLVMEYLEGRSLAQALRDEAPFRPDRIISVCSQLLEALAEAHASGIVHRDLKPENILLTSVFGRSEFVKILDFGIAKVIDGDGSLTQTGHFVGSPRYMAPEQVQSSWVSERTDLYALGAILYEMLTGRAVFQAETPTGYLLAHVNELPDPPHRGGRLLTGPIVDLCMQCLRKRPEERPASALVALQHLAACEGIEVTVGDPGSAAEAITRRDTLTEGDPSTLSGPVALRAPGDGTPDSLSTGAGTTSASRPDLDIAPRRRSWFVPAALAATVITVAAGAVLLFTGGPDESGARTTIAIDDHSHPAPDVSTRPTEKAPGSKGARPTAARPQVLAASAKPDQARPGANAKPESKPADTADAKPAVTADPEPAVTAQAKPADTAQAKPADTAQAKPADPGEAKPEAKPEAPAEAKPEVDPKPAATDKPDNDTLQAPTTRPAQPEAPEPKMLSARVTSAPDGATVYIGGQKIGKTPVTVMWRADEPPPTVTLKRSGYYKATLEPTAEQAGGTEPVKLKRRRSRYDYL